MIGLLYNESEVAKLAVTSTSVRRNPAQLDKGVVWYSDNPTHSQRDVASWSGLMSDVFDLHGSMTVAKAKRLAKRIDMAVPPEFQIPGKNLRAAMYDCLPGLFKLLDPFPESVSEKFLDKVRVSVPGRGYCHTTDSLKNSSLKDFMLPESLARTKIMPTGGTGQKQGVYLVKPVGLTGIYESLNNKSRWVTSHQLIRLRKGGELQIKEGVVVLGDKPMIPLHEHPLTERFMEIRKRVPEEATKYYDSLLLRFLMNIPRAGGIHPFSLLLKGQAWLKSGLQAQKQANNGIKIVSFDSHSITAELDDYEQNV